MRFSLSPEEQQVLDEARRVVAEELAPRIAAEGPDAPLPKAVLQACYAHIAALGAFGARVPAPEGGTDLSHVELGLVMETLPPLLAVSCISHEASTCRLSLGGEPELKARYLGEFVAGRLIAGTAVTEPEAGSDPRGMSTVVERHGERLRVRGTKLWTGNGTVADVLVVVGALEGGLVRVLVDTRETPVDARVVPTAGLRQAHLSEVHVDVEVPAGHLIGEPGDASRALTATWLCNRPNMGLVASHIARDAIDAAIAYARERTQFGRPIGSFQLVQELIAEMTTSWSAGRLLSYQALAALDEGRAPVAEASMAKAFATEAAVQTVLKAQQVMGSNAIRRDHPLDGLLHDARMLTFPDGTTQINQLITGRELLGLRAFS